MSAEDSVQTDYYNELKEERSKIDNSLRKVINLVDKEIERLENNITEEEIFKFTDATKDKPIKLKERIMIPIKEFPKFNFVGKILGPKGNTLKRLQEQTACRMSVLGKGSVRSKEEEDKLLATGDPKFNHLRSELHVCVEVFAPPLEAYGRMSHAISIIKPFLVPSDFNDDVRSAQFEELAMLGVNHGAPRMPGPGVPWKNSPVGGKKMRGSMGAPPPKRMAPNPIASSMSGMGNYGMPEADYGYDNYGNMPSGMGGYSNGSGYGAPTNDRYGMGSGNRGAMSTEYNHLNSDYYGAPGGGDMGGGGAYTSPYSTSNAQMSFEKPQSMGYQGMSRGGKGGRGRGRGGGARPTW